MTSRIFISGLTAAGKTTHSKLLAEQLHQPYISSSSILLQKAEIDTSLLSPNFWISKDAAELGDRRVKDKSMDTWVDETLVSMSTQMGNAVFDTWGLPWLSNEKGLRIWLESNITSRLWKAIVSHEAVLDVNHEKVREEVIKKDYFIRDYFKNNYGFDIFQDYELFDYIIDISSFIESPSVVASIKSVNISHEIVSAIVDASLSPSLQHLSRLTQLISTYGKTVFLKTPVDGTPFYTGDIG